MTVRELIERLNTFNPDANVCVAHMDATIDLDGSELDTDNVVPFQIRHIHDGWNVETEGDTVSIEIATPISGDGDDPDVHSNDERYFYNVKNPV